MEQIRLALPVTDAAQAMVREFGTAKTLFAVLRASMMIGRAPPAMPTDPQIRRDCGFDPLPEAPASLAISLTCGW